MALAIIRKYKIFAKIFRHVELDDLTDTLMQHLFCINCLILFDAKNPLISKGEN